jgi:hypothetical protein
MPCILISHDYSHHCQVAGKLVAYQIPKPNTAIASNNQSASKNKQRSDDYTNRSQDETPSDRWLNGGLILVGILQLLVFGEQARQLRKSIDLTRTIAERQEKDMRDSIGEASRAAAAAEMSATVAKDTIDAYRNAERAWLGFSAIDTFNFTNSWIGGVPVKEGVFFVVRIVTPAIDVNCFSSIKVIRIDDTDVPIFPKPTIDVPRTAVVVPNTFVAVPEMAIGGNDVANVKSSTSKIILWALLEYRDTLDSKTTRITELCVEGRYAGEATNNVTKQQFPRFNFGPVATYQNRAT